MRKTDPYSEIKRAPYALPKGVPALQEEPQRTRRMLLLAAAGGLVAGCGLAWLSGWSRTTGENKNALSPAGTDALLRWARRFSGGAEGPLLNNAPAFLAVVESHAEDPQLWEGLERLVKRAERDPEFEIQGVRLRERLSGALGALTGKIPPSLFTRLEALQAPPGHQRPRK